MSIVVGDFGPMKIIKEGIHLRMQDGSETNSKDAQLKSV